MKWSVVQYRNHNDFTYGSFTAYVTEREIVIRGILKKNHNPSLYMMIRRAIDG